MPLKLAVEFVFICLPRTQLLAFHHHFTNKDLEIKYCLMKSMKRIKYLLLLSFLMVKLSASAEIDCVAICDKEDKETIIPIKDASEITFDANLMVIGSEIYNMNLLKKYYFADSENLGVQEISGEITGLTIDPKGLISFGESLETENIEVYNLSGLSQPFHLIGNVIDIRNLQPDVYIVKIGAASIKLVKK